jgi:hypothetical protein
VPFVSVKGLKPVLVFIAVLSLSPTLFSETRINKVSEAFHQAEDFLRIPEFFTGKEYFGKQFIVRTNKERSGFYFAMELNKPASDLPEECNVLIQVVRSDRPAPQSYRLPLGVTNHSRKEILLGITGEDWNSREIKPLAWRIELRTGSGNLLASKQSFLWGHPK